MIVISPRNTLLLPGWQNSGPDHWQSRWEALHGYHRVEQHDWMRPLRGDWSARLEETVADADFDFVLIDCPPSLNMLTLNGLCSAHGVIVPMQCEYFALEGLTDLVNTIKQVHANLNADLQIIGLLRVMFDPRITLQQQVSDQLKGHFGEKVFNSVIPRNVRLAEAPSYGLPGVVFDPSAKGSQAFVEFAQEMVARVQRMGAPKAQAKSASGA